MGLHVNLDALITIALILGCCFAQVRSQGDQPQPAEPEAPDPAAEVPDENPKPYVTVPSTSVTNNSSTNGKKTEDCEETRKLREEYNEVLGNIRKEQIENGVYCFTCSSANENSSCADPDALERAAKDLTDAEEKGIIALCTQPEELCYKWERTLEDGTYWIKRSCSSELKTNGFDAEFERCVSESRPAKFGRLCLCRGSSASKPCNQASTISIMNYLTVLASTAALLKVLHY